MESFNVYLCPDPWEPSGICVKNACSRGISYSVENRSLLSGVDERYLPLTVNAEIGRRGNEGSAGIHTVLRDKNCLDVIPFSPCGSILPENRRISYYYSDSKLAYYINMPDICGLESVSIVWGKDSFTIHTPSSSGEITGRNPGYVWSDTETFYINPRDKYPVPGTSVTVNLKLKNGASIYYASSFFETELFTSAVTVGCGLWSDGVFLEGGEGVEFNGEWVGSSDLRWLVDFRKKRYALKPSDYFDYGLDSRVCIGKGIIGSGLQPLGSFSSASVRETLDEEADLILPVALYG
ncbi:hypothetical protein [Limisalsivibrio acetivorans]|uniref:hypothetical protein n=1 Tax=Limisalsivibrio acetivorans TaxID=1304888 RepID=UPI0003B6514D|nr:hypothetical protein [Limisalsivibrio acetivorans]